MLLVRHAGYVGINVVAARAAIAAPAEIRPIRLLLALRRDRGLNITEVEGLRELGERRAEAYIVKTIRLRRRARRRHGKQKQNALIPPTDANRDL